MQFVDFFLHLDHHINTIIEHYGTWTYLIVFLIVFCETGLVFTPFLPGDSLLFVLGAFAATGSLDLYTLIGLLTLAAISPRTLSLSAGSKPFFIYSCFSCLILRNISSTRCAFSEVSSYKKVNVGTRFKLSSFLPKTERICGTDCRNTS